MNSLGNPEILVIEVGHWFSRQMVYRFSDCVLDLNAFTLTRSGEPQKVEPQVFDFLRLLVTNPGVMISKDRLVDELWGGRVISESAISACISAARKAVGDDGKRQDIIKTISRRGVQFVADVQADGAEAAPAAPDRRFRKIRYATAEDGIKIAYGASGSGPALIKIDHFPSHLELDWGEEIGRALLDALGETNEVVCFDVRGCGLSDHDVSDFSPLRNALDLKHVADDAKLDRFALMGSSGGALSAVEFAARHPERLTHLVLHSGYAEGRLVREGANTQETEVILQMAGQGWDNPESAFVQAFISLYCPTATPEQLANVAERLQKSCSTENALHGRDAVNQASIVHLLGQIKTPTLVVHSIGDSVHPVSEAQKLARGIEGAELHLLETRNHYPLPQEPAFDELVEVVSNFLKT